MRLSFDQLFAGGCVLSLLLWACVPPSTDSEQAGFSLKDTLLVIPQVDYEDAIHLVPGNPYPQLDRSAVRTDRIIDKEHSAIVLANRYVRLTLLPEMGRVYSLVPKSTGNEVFWQNDTVTVGGASNPNGWWIWIGGAEYTLPGDEHGTTWAERWAHEVVRNDEDAKSVRMSVTERGTGLEEDIVITLYSNRSFYEANIQIFNPTADTVMFAHWINPQWAPGGRNQLTDNTEFFIPTQRVLIPERFREALGDSPQEWQSSPLRFIRGWSRGWGDLMADGIEHGFYGAFSHDVGEGVVRVFDKEKNPGVDIWTYGFRPRTPRGIPMGSGKENDGYVEMWGGTSKIYPDERRPILPGATISWTEWMYPFHGTGGLSYANEHVAVFLERGNENAGKTLGISSTGIFAGVRALVMAGADTLLTESLTITPEAPVRRTLGQWVGDGPIRVRLELDGRTLADFESNLKEGAR